RMEQRSRFTRTRGQGMMWAVPHPTTHHREPVQRRSTERLTHNLDARAELLHGVDYNALSTRAVSERGGVPSGSEYRITVNQPQLADALAHRSLERFTDRIAERLRGTGDRGWRYAMDAVIGEYLHMKRNAPGFSLVDFGNQIPVGG